MRAGKVTTIQRRAVGKDKNAHKQIGKKMKAAAIQHKEQRERLKRALIYVEDVETPV